MAPFLAAGVVLVKFKQESALEVDQHHPVCEGTGPIS
jgi:hypothetical protein